MTLPIQWTKRGPTHHVGSLAGDPVAYVFKAPGGRLWRLRMRADEVPDAQPFSTQRAAMDEAARRVLDDTRRAP